MSFLRPDIPMEEVVCPICTLLGRHTKLAEHLVGLGVWWCHRCHQWVVVDRRTVSVL